MLAIGRLRVSDQSIGPQIGDIDLDRVLAGAKLRISAQGVWSLPEDCSGLAVDPDRGYFMYLA